MKIWISKNSEVPVRDQLMAQITLGIVAGDLKTGEKLPSTREIARRCDLHANTVGSAYQKLADQDLLEFRKGSGFYVAESAGKAIEGARQLEKLIEKFFESARDLGFEKDAVIQRIKRHKGPGLVKRIVVIEPDAGLRDILVHELSEAFPEARGISTEETVSAKIPKDAILVAMFDEKARIDAELNDGQKCIYLKGRSVSASMSGETRPSENDLVAVISGWDGFLTFARIMLLAAKLDPGHLIVRSTNNEGWMSAIKNASIVICDSLTASRLDGHHGIRTFRIVADESLAELSMILRPVKSS